MKTKILKILSIFLITLFFGCEEFLKEEPRALLSPTVFFNSDVEAKAYVNGIYSTYMFDVGLYNVIGLSRYYMNGTDLIQPNRYGGEGADFSLYTITEGNNPTRNTWQALYRVIQDCNIVLDRIEDNENISSNTYNQVRGETLFLRALAYYHAVNIWKDVPYYTENLPIEEIQVLGRHDKDEIQLDMIEDLKEAQTLLPDKYADNERGRATKWVAATLEAKFYMVRNDWQNMKNKSVEIINNSWHRLLDDYGAVFNDYPLDEYNDEIIWQFDYVKDIANQRRTDFFTPRLRDEPKNTADRNALGADLAARDEGFTGYGLAIPTPEIVNTYPEDDLRRPWNVTTSYLGYELKWPYIPKLWNLHQINSPRSNHGDNTIIFRLADIYLMAAEAENELNGPGNAYQYVNKVRERAYEPDKPLSGLSQDEFRQAIRDERAWELMGEDHRRIDLVRWGILVETVRNTEYNPSFTEAPNNIEPHHTHFPIPIEEFELNPALLESDPTNNGYR
jgi:hypothetical protein